MNRLTDRIFDWFAILASLGGMGCLATCLLLTFLAPAALLFAAAWALLHWSGAV